MNQPNEYVMVMQLEIAYIKSGQEIVATYPAPDGCLFNPLTWVIKPEHQTGEHIQKRLWNRLIRLGE